MAWTAPKTWVKGELFTAVLANVHLRDNLNALRPGGIAIAGQTAQDFVFASGAGQFGRVAAASGKIPRFNGVTNQWEMIVPLEAHWPVGSVYKAGVSTNPASLLGFGTWAAYGPGCVTVGINAGDPDFATVGQTGGSKTHTLTVAELPSHTHTQDAHTHTQNSHNHTQDAHSHTLANFGNTALSGTTFTPPPLEGVVDNTGTRTLSSTTATNNAATAVNQNTVATNQNTGGGGSHHNVMPYIVGYRWVRTA